MIITVLLCRAIIVVCKVSSGSSPVDHSHGLESLNPHMLALTLLFGSFLAVTQAKISIWISCKFQNTFAMLRILLQCPH